MKPGTIVKLHPSCGPGAIIKHGCMWKVLMGDGRHYRIESISTGYHTNLYISNNARNDSLATIISTPEEGDDT